MRTVFNKIYLFIQIYYGSFIRNSENRYSGHNWKFVQDLPNIEEKNNFLSNAIKTIFDIHAPYRKPYKPYITETIRDISKLKHKAYKDYKKNQI